LSLADHDGDRQEAAAGNRLLLLPLKGVALPMVNGSSCFAWMHPTGHDLDVRPAVGLMLSGVGDDAVKFARSVDAADQRA
jgi:hypothetical protein